MTEVIPLEQVQLRNKEGQTWIIIDRLVYNVTEFKAEHPGGAQVLLDIAGKSMPDATQAFHDIGHSGDAKELLKKFLIGVLEEDSETRPIRRRAKACILL
ncbi:cytochrome b5 isoform X2 [Lingula anatina]|uniref:Cytochrome b5 isoform X2 n=1 Tax=Lingula anatina TaxID=7574 RepID=A0A1S3JAQ3_LINAN|nr:cytochrome b5 isoform X2 [Lingula anatina]|eukprot:XP_013407403.1 cytochrome b5 isoform X2 [Lingula anatina]